MEQIFLILNGLFVTEGCNLVLMSHKIVSYRLILTKMCLVCLVSGWSLQIIIIVQISGNFSTIMVSFVI